MTNGYTSSADYYLMESVLKALWQSFEELSDEIRSFVPKSIKEIREENKQKLIDIWMKRSGKSAEDIDDFVEQQLAAQSSIQAQFSYKFENKFMIQYVTLIFMSHSLCEAIINAILATGFFENGLAKKFAAIERKSVVEKWLKAPQEFCPTYELKRESPLFETLEHLTQQRNSLTHYKINLQAGDEIIYEGSGFQHLPFQENAQWMRRFFSLPYDLAAHAFKQIPQNSVSAMILYRRAPIPIADPHLSSQITE